MSNDNVAGTVFPSMSDALMKKGIFASPSVGTLMDWGTDTLSATGGVPDDRVNVGFLKRTDASFSDIKTSETIYSPSSDGRTGTVICVHDG